MKKVLLLCMVLSLVFPLMILANDGKEKIKIDLDKVDSLFEKGLKENYQQKGVDLMEESLNICLQLNQNHPNNYEILWRCARSAGEYGESARGIELEGWKPICKEWGKKGLEFAKQAQKLEPNRVEAYFWGIQCVGVYEAATTIWTAIKEGFVGIIRSSIQKSLELDRTYMDYSPVYACAMFNFKCPRIAGGDKKKAYQYFDEFVEKASWSFEPYIRRPLAAKLLIKRYGKKDNSRAKEMITLALQNPNPRKLHYNVAKEIEKKLR